MRKIIILIVLTIMLIPVAGQAQSSTAVPILCYHDVGNKTNDYTVTLEILEKHFAYLKEHNYNPISLDQFIAAQKTGAALPPNPVMLSFDDGYISFYKQVYPLAKKYNYPIMLAIVPAWLDYTPSELGTLVNWQQIREMDNSGLITIASHSYGFHRFAPQNPQGDLGRMMEVFIYRDGRYETLLEYEARVRQDLVQSQAVAEKELGHKFRALVWPFGAYTNIAVDIGREQGFEAFFRLNDGLNYGDKRSLNNANRIIIYGNPSVETLEKLLKTGSTEPKSHIISQLDIDLIYDPDSPRQTEINLNMALKRLQDSKVDTVFLQAFSDMDGDGNIKSVYFHTTEAPVRANIFDHIAVKLRENRIRVYAWMPTLAAQWIIDKNPGALVTAYDPKGLGWYRRATPFSTGVQSQLKRLFTDLAMYVPIDGILFQDDMYLTDYEDFSQPAKATFLAKFGQPLTTDILKDSAIQAEWTKMKTAALTDLTKELMNTVRRFRPEAQSARNIYAEAVTNPKSTEWFAQDYKQYLNTYDYTVIMAYPAMEKKDKIAVAWLQELAGAALQDKDAANKVIFKIQTYDWNKKRWIPDSELRRQVQALKAKGAMHIGYYPENVFWE